MNRQEEKSFIDELAELSRKLEYSKPLLQRMLGIQSQPAKSLFEFLSTVIVNASPYISEAIKTYMNGMITIEMIRKGLVGKEILGILQQNTIQQQQQLSQITKPKINIEFHESQSGFSGNNSNKNFETMFYEKFEELLSSDLTEEHITNKMIEFILQTANSNPQYIIEILNMGSREDIINKIYTIIFKLTESKQLSLRMATNIVDGVIKSFERQ